MAIGVNDVAWGDRHSVDCDGDCIVNDVHPGMRWAVKACKGTKSFCPHVGISDRAVGYDAN